MLKRSATDLLSQLTEAIIQCKEEDFSKPLPVLSGATFGQHVRHTLEFFICLFDARNDGAINYDKRKHDQQMETDKHLCLSVIGSIIAFIEQVQGDFPVHFEASYVADTPKPVAMPSSFYRELAYNIEHAIHHMALMKVAIVYALSYIEVPASFGVASSTIRYRTTAE